MFLKRAKKRTPLNELDPRLSCSIIGTCLSLKELRKLSRQTKLAGLDKTSEYDLHRIYVGIAQEDSYVNRRLHKLMDQKFQKTIKQFTVIKNEGELKKQWDKAQKTGDIASVYWALITHPVATNRLVDMVYGDIHMLSHIAGASMRVDLHELSVLRSESSLLKKQQQQSYHKHHRTVYEKDALLRKYEKMIQKQRMEINAMRIALMQENQPEKPKEKQTTETQYKIQQLEKKVANYHSEWDRTISKQVVLEKQLHQSHAEINSMEFLLNSYLLANNTSCSSSQHCQNKDLKGQCILYVGGRDKQCQHFKPLVENSNGQFMHHDGGLNDGKNRLNSILVQADVVMCPLDCISHEAMIKIKKHCKITEKPLVMMPRSSLSAFSKGLVDIGKLKNDTSNLNRGNS
jgi:hypothetical protein